MVLHLENIRKFFGLIEKRINQSVSVLGSVQPVVNVGSKIKIIESQPFVCGAVSGNGWHKIFQAPSGEKYRIMSITVHKGSGEMTFSAVGYTGLPNSTAVASVTPDATAVFENASFPYLIVKELYAYCYGLTTSGIPKYSALVEVLPDA